MHHSFLTENSRSNSHEYNQLPAAGWAAQQGHALDDSGWANARASDTGDASESHWYEDLTGPLEWQKRGRSWAAGNDGNMDIRKVLIWKKKEKLRQMGLEDKVIVVD